MEIRGTKKVNSDKGEVKWRMKEIGYNLSKQEVLQKKEFTFFPKISQLVEVSL